jgi:glycosyltransferase involved in cell wall biosynthesis
MTVHEIVEPHGSAARRLALTWTNRLHFMRPAFRRLLVHTQSDAEKLAAMGIQAGRIRIVRHGVPPAPNLPDPIEAKRELGLEGKFVLTIFGFLSRKKGHLTAIEAMRHLPEEVTLLIAGGRHPSDRSGFPDMLERIAAERSLEGRVRVTGYLAREAVATTMAATDLVLAPFTESSGSGSLAMAFACGKPIVASDIGPHRELVDMQPGVMELAGHGDAAGLASAIEELRSSPERLRGLSECARALAGASSYEMIGARLVEIYREAIG